MKHRPHVQIISQARPATAELQPVWEFIYIIQALLGLVSTVIGQGGQILGAIQTFLGLFGQFKGVPQT